MSLKTYGIYLAYPPTVDLRTEGLGRHLAAFLKGASALQGVRFVIVCPSWSKTSITELCKSEGVMQTGFDVITPNGYLISLKCYELYLVYRTKIKACKSWLAKKRDKNRIQSISLYPLRVKLASARSLSDLRFLIPGILVLGMLTLTSKLLLIIKRALFSSVNRICCPVKKILARFLPHLQVILKNPQNNSGIFELFQNIAERETSLMLDLINSMDHISAWFTPTAFWPSFNKIKGPKFICVPDVVLTEFPTGFADIGADRFLETFRLVEKTIHEGSNFITYSNHIKQTVLIDRYSVNPNNIHVVRHATNHMSSFITLEHMPAEASNQYCKNMVLSAMKKSSNFEYTHGFEHSDFKFVFYASQFRPSKNILNLLRAWHELIRNRWVNHKLILTGKPSVIKEADNYISEHHMEKDILLLSGLNIQELAACYKLADLAVNPSLSEGGCPFTLTEALSVGTPVVMANIAVTREIVHEPDLQGIMLFDPYDWHNIADRIQWALENREQLLEQQLKKYKVLSQRTWQHVAEEYIQILDDAVEQKTARITETRSFRSFEPEQA